VRRYNVEGLETWAGQGREPILSEEERQLVAERVEAGPQDSDVCSLRGVDFHKFLETQFGKLLSLTAVSRLLHELGDEWLVPRPKHRKADPEAIAAFQQKSPPSWRGSQAEHPRQQVIAFFEDECRFGQQETLTRGWARRSSRPTAVRQTEDNDDQVIGAASPQTGQAGAILSPVLNTAIINQFAGQLQSHCI
jgi:transposase